MKTNIQIKIKMAWAACAANIHRIAHAIAAVTCGIVMGVLVASNAGLLETKNFEGQLIPEQQFSPPIFALPENPSSASILSSSVASTSASSSERMVVKPASHPAAPEQRSSSISSQEPTSESSKAEEVSSVSSSAQSEKPAASQASEQSSSTSSAVQTVKSTEAFPPFLHTSFPVAVVPNWGAMRTPEEWNRTYKELTAGDFVAIPRYDLAVLTTPMDSLTTPLRDENMPKITAKLFYSTRFFGSYDTDAGEFTGTHPALDLKLARGTPLGAIAGGRVSYVEKTEMYGLMVVIEHRLKSGETFYSIYGHLDAAFVKAGETVIPGDSVGIVGMTGNTTAPHLHLQIDKGTAGEAHHTPYLPSSIPSSAEALTHVVHPITFIGRYRSGE